MMINKGLCRRYGVFTPYEVFVDSAPTHQVGAKQWSVATISLDELRAAMERAEARYLRRTA